MNKPVDWARNRVKQLANIIAKYLDRVSRGRITPNMITITGLLAHVYIAALIAQQRFAWAGLLLIFFGLFDTLDGSLARLQKRSSSKGMLLDSITDRVKEIMLYAGISYVLVSQDLPYFAVWATVACGASLLVSYINSWGEVVLHKNKSTDHQANQALRTGLMTFEIRMLTIVLGLLSGYLKEAILIVAVISLLTAWQRFNHITKNYV